MLRHWVYPTVNKIVFKSNFGPGPKSCRSLSLLSQCKSQVLHKHQIAINHCRWFSSDRVPDRRKKSKGNLYSRTLNLGLFKVQVKARDPTQDATATSKLKENNDPVEVPSGAFQFALKPLHLIMCTSFILYLCYKYRGILQSKNMIQDQIQYQNQNLETYVNYMPQQALHGHPNHVQLYQTNNTMSMNNDNSYGINQIHSDASNPYDLDNNAESYISNNTQNSPVPMENSNLNYNQNAMNPNYSNYGNNMSPIPGGNSSNSVSWMNKLAEYM